MQEALENIMCNKGLAKLSSLALESTIEVNNVDSFLVSFSHDGIFVGSLEVPISRLWYAEGEFLKVVEARGSSRK